jgi:hypothetical protein
MRRVGEMIDHEEHKEIHEVEALVFCALFVVKSFSCNLDLT